jgi:hypothetical protein
VDNHLFKEKMELKLTETNRFNKIFKNIIGI